MIPRPLNEIRRVDLRNVIDGKAGESNTLASKRDLPDSAEPAGRGAP